MKKKTAAIAIVVMLMGFFTRSAWGALAEPVSPGGKEGLTVTGQTCPSFSWSAAADAAAYRLEIYELVTDYAISRDQIRQTALPVIIKEIPAPAFSWTPSVGECLARGVNYVWYVQGLNAGAEGLWSEGRVFGIEPQALSVEQKEAVQEVLREYLETDSSAGKTDATDTTSGGATPEGKTTSNISVPMTATEGTYNTLLGNGAGAALTTPLTGSEFVTFIGSLAGNRNSTGAYNTFVGRRAGYLNTTGSNNNFFGYAAGNSNNGSDNSFFGHNAGYSNTTGYNNSFVGKEAGYSNTTGDYNSFVGYNAGYFTSTGGDNSFFGGGAGLYNTTGIANSFVGKEAGYSNTTGGFNSFVGYNAGHNNSTGNYNASFGHNAGFFSSTGYNNSFFGNAAGFNNTGSNNVFLGSMAGITEIGSDKLYIDNCYTGDTPATGGQCTQPLIYGEFDNRVVKIDGSLSIVSVATPSDIRYKKEIHPLESSIEKVLELRGVTYEWDKDKVKGAGYKSGRQIGLIAQEVEKVLPELVHTDSNGYKTLSYDKLAPVLIEAVKEQQTMIKEQQSDMKRKDARIKKLEKERALITGMLEELSMRIAAIEGPMRTVASK